MGAHPEELLKVVKRWERVVPRVVAVAQASNERYRLVWRLRERGLTYKEIGRLIGVNGERARQLCCYAIVKSRGATPVERYFQEPTDVYALRQQLKRGQQ